MNLLESRAIWGLWVLEFGVGATALFLTAKSVVHSFLATDQSIARGELNFGCMAGLAAIGLGFILLNRSK